MKLELQFTELNKLLVKFVIAGVDKKVGHRDNIAGFQIRCKESKNISKERKGRISIV
jgi:hypothetical protein